MSTVTRIAVSPLFYKRPGILLPFELYEVIDRVSMLPVGVLQLNLVIVLYLVGKLSQHNPALGGVCPQTSVICWA